MREKHEVLLWNVQSDPNNLDQSQSRAAWMQPKKKKLIGKSEL